jgi:ABC-2 type transport system ATP-binding protein
VSVLGADPSHGGRHWRERFGIVLQESQPDPGLTVSQALNLYAGYYSAPLALSEVLALTRLEEHRDRIATELSGGQRRRLDLALALAGDPDLVFLDEPTTGFDPSARLDTWDVIGNLRALGKTILLTTHHMDEAEALADDIAVIVGGRIVARGAPGTLGGRQRAATKIHYQLPTDERVELATSAPLDELERIAAWSRESGTRITQLTVAPPSLEDVYLSLIGETA